MTILGGIAPDCGESSIRQAAGAILDAAEQQQLTSRPWSLAELRFDDADLDWLLVWARGSRQPFLRACLDSWRDAEILGHQLHMQAATGLLFMALFAEVGRRDAHEGSLWGRVVDLVFQSEPPDCLFVQGQPSHLLKEALEDAARSAGLRHVFGVEGVQNWFRSVYLQFGFTKTGFEQRLPEWLAGQPATVAVEGLLGSRSLRSESFCAVWDSLRNYRRRNVSQEQCRKTLVSSSWVLADWADDLMRCALKRIELGTSSGIRDVDSPPPVFLGPARLVWEPHQTPRFLTRVVNLPSYDLGSPTYRLMVDGQTKAQLLLQADGLYHVEPSDELSLEAHHPVAHAELVDAYGTVEHVTDLELWDAAEDVTLFKVPSGVPVTDPYVGLPPTAQYALLCPSDLALRPEASDWAKVARGKFVLQLLPREWQAQRVALLLGEEELWRPRAKLERQPPLPEWASGVRVTRRQPKVRLGEPLELDITHPPTANVTFVRINGQTRAFSPSNEWQTGVEPIVLDGELRGGNLKVTLGVRLDECHLTLQRETTVSVEGVAMRSADGWIPLSPREDLDVRTARSNSFRMLPPRDDPDRSLRDWGILEGNTFVRRVPAYPGPIEGLAGLGGELRIRYGPYNSVEGPMDVAASVVNRGVIRDVAGTGEGSQFAVVIEGHIEPDSGGHFVVWCDADGTQSIVRPSSFHLLDDSNATVWTCPRPEGAGAPWAIGAGFRGEWLGAWWDTDWHRRLLETDDSAAGERAAMLRWLHLPVLASSVRSSMLAFVRESPQAAAEAWIRSEHLPTGLVHGYVDDAWLGAVRSLFDVGLGSGAWLCAIFDAFDEGGEATPEAFDAAAKELMRVNPVLMGRVLFAAALKRLIPVVGKLGVAGILEGIVCRLALSSSSAVDDDVGQAIDDLALQVASDVGVGWPADIGFVKQGLLERALRRVDGRSAGTDFDEANVNLALGIDPFRRLLALCVLRDKILPKFTN